MAVNRHPRQARIAPVKSPRLARVVHAGPRGKRGLQSVRVVRHCAGCANVVTAACRAARHGGAWKPAVNSRVRYNLQLHRRLFGLDPRNARAIYHMHRCVIFSHAPWLIGHVLTLFWLSSWAQLDQRLTPWPLELPDIYRASCKVGWPLYCCEVWAL